jgi:hypothetical protein
MDCGTHIAVYSLSVIALGGSDFMPPKPLEAQHCLLKNPT